MSFSFTGAPRRVIRRVGEETSDSPAFCSIFASFFFNHRRCHLEILDVRWGFVFYFLFFLKINLTSDFCFGWWTSGWCCKDLRVDQCVAVNLQHVAHITVTITDSLSDSWKRLKKEFWALSLHPTQNYRFRCCVFVHLHGSRGRTTVIKDFVR